MRSNDKGNRRFDGRSHTHAHTSFEDFFSLLITKLFVFFFQIKDRSVFTQNNRNRCNTTTTALRRRLLVYLSEKSTGAAAALTGRYRNAVVPLHVRTVYDRLLFLKFRTSNRQCYVGLNFTCKQSVYPERFTVAARFALLFETSVYKS